MRVLWHVLSTWSEWMKTTCPVWLNMPNHTHFTLLLELTSWVHQGGYKEYISLVRPLWQHNECARTATVFFPISQVWARGVTLVFVGQFNKHHNAMQGNVMHWGLLKKLNKIQNCTSLEGSTVWLFCIGTAYLEINDITIIRTHGKM